MTNFGVSNCISNVSKLLVCILIVTRKIPIFYALAIANDIRFSLDFISYYFFALIGANMTTAFILLRKARSKSIFAKGI
jgi:hypothetical protein